MHWVPHATACIQGKYVVCSSRGIQWCWGMYLLSGEIKRLVLERTGTWVEFCHSYNEFDSFNSYGGCLELQLSLYLSVQSKEILQTIRGTRRNSRYIWVSETSTQQLYQTLRILHASFLPFLLCLRNITLKDMEGHLPWWNNRSTIMKFSGIPSRLFLVLSMNFSTLECLCFTQTVRWGNVILLSLHGQLTTSNTFTCTRWSGPIAVCAKQQNCHLEKGIHCLSNWETSSYTSRWWYLWLREMRWRDRRQHNIWKLEWLEPQKVSSEIWNASPQRGIVPDILHTVNLGILKHLMVCVTFLFKQHSSIDEFNQLWAMMPPYPSSTQFNKPYRQMTQWSRNEINAHGRVIDQVFAVTLVNHSARHKIPFTEA